MTFHKPIKSKLGNISKPSNAVLKCVNPQTVRIKAKKDGTRDKYISRRCRSCWQCVTSQQNDIVGKLLAQSAVTARIELHTLTYDDNSPESRLGSKQRIPAHLQKFQKALRQREQRGLTAYNKAEKKRAALEGREPRLIDKSRSYIKFFPVFEFGTKNGRGHWHVMIFFESHFELPFHAFNSLEPEVCPSAAKRVWDPPSVRGAETKTLPPDANNPDVIDYRVKEHGSQKHSLWPHGFVNIECVSHDMRATDYGGNPVDARKPSEGVVSSMFYLLKYLSKPDTKYKDHELTEEELDEQNKTLKKARGGNQMYRTGSQGLGRAFAREFARRHADNGVPLNHIHFKVSGANVPRTHASLTRFRAKLVASMGEINAEQYLIEAQKMVFQMQGGMAAIAADTYLEIALAKGKKNDALGDVAQMRLRQLEAKKANEWLRSAEGKFRRKVAREVTLIDKVKFDVALRDCHPMVQQMLSGGFFGNSLPSCILPPEPYMGFIIGEGAVPDFAVLKAQGCTANTELEKLEATVDAVKIVSDLYKSIKYDSAKYQTEKSKQSGQWDCASPYIPPTIKTNRDEYTQAIYEQTLTEEWEAHFAGCGHASDLLYALELARGHVHRSDRKPWSFNEFDAPQRLGLLWLNHSDQYMFTLQRERHIKKYCAVRYLSEDQRLIITPDGRILLGRYGISDKYRDNVSGHGNISRYKTTFKKWGYRLVQPEKLDFAISGKMPLRSFQDSDPIFLNIEQPFKNTWAMALEPEHKDVLRLAHPLDGECKLGKPPKQISASKIQELEFEDLPF